MGLQTRIRTTSEEENEYDYAPILGRDFTYEIALGYLFEDRSFLSDEEWQRLEPQNMDSHVYKERTSLNPTVLISILYKVKEYLNDNQNTLPFEIELDYEKMKKEDLSSDIIINGSLCWIQGDSKIYDVSTKVGIVNHPQQPHQVDLWIDIQDKIEIEGKIYYLRKVTRFDRYKELIDKVIEFCEYAKSSNNNVYWTLSQ